MKAAVYYARENLTVEQIPTPDLADGEILLQVDACCVCGTDLRTYRFGDPKIQPPRVLGHEFCGRIVESRANGTGGPKIGDRVVMYIVLGCGSCRYCQVGRQNLCTNRRTMSYHLDGAFAEFVKIPAEAVQRGQVFAVKNDLPSKHLSLAEPLGCVMNAHSHLGIGLRDTVLVIGAGPIGTMHAILARLAGARSVVMADTSSRRLEKAQTFDLDQTVLVSSTKEHHARIAELTDGFGPSVVIVACSVAAAQTDALELAGKGGRVEFFGGLPKSNPEGLLNTNHIHYKELQVSGSYSEKMSDFLAARSLIETGKIPADKLITHELGLGSITDAFGLMESGEALKVCIDPQK
jgi:L-iditol 2-dehydrogenase